MSHKVYDNNHSNHISCIRTNELTQAHAQLKFRQRLHDETIFRVVCTHIEIKIYLCITISFFIIFNYLINMTRISALLKQFIYNFTLLTNKESGVR